MQLVHCLITELLGLRRIHVNIGRYAVLVIKNPKSIKPQTQATQTSFSYPSVGNTCTASPLRLASLSLSDDTTCCTTFFVLNTGHPVLWGLHNPHTQEHIWISKLLYYWNDWIAVGSRDWDVWYSSCYTVSLFELHSWTCVTGTRPLFHANIPATQCTMNTHCTWRATVGSNPRRTYNCTGNWWNE